ncbi:hypothetical protein WA158_004053 [Blastocystis sp. Blastoise]
MLKYQRVPGVEDQELAANGTLIASIVYLVLTLIFTLTYFVTKSRPTNSPVVDTDTHYKRTQYLVNKARATSEFSINRHSSLRKEHTKQIQEEQDNKVPLMEAKHE